MLSRAVNRVVGPLAYPFQRMLGRWLGEERTCLVAPDATPEERADIANRFAFFVPPESRFRELSVCSALPLRTALTSAPVLLFGARDGKAHLARLLRRGVFDVDFRANPGDAWEWSLFASYCATRPPDFSEVRLRFTRAVERLRAQRLHKAYVFGTGPSLAKAMDRDWSDGYRIVCNTIVRDAELWRHLRPHFIVAGDANYHFAGNGHARAFRRDLRLRLGETDTLFVFPHVFYEVVRREFSDMADRLVPVPIGLRRSIPLDLCARFRLPGLLGNVLPLLLLPLACTLARDVGLWGFDGRAPKDKFFWSNSNRHSYPELFPELTRDHPAFFAHHVPAKDPLRYVRAVHGEVLERALCSAERRGWRFTMLHPSWTPTLQKRYKEAVDPSTEAAADASPAAGAKRAQGD